LLLQRNSRYIKDMIRDLQADPRSALSLSTTQVYQLKKLYFDERISEFGNLLDCFAPPFDLAPYEIPDFKPSGSRSFISFSTTGSYCELQCEHCKGRLLQYMDHCSLEQFPSLVERALSTGTKGFLLSGGANKMGKVPFYPYLEILHSFKEQKDFAILIHSGLLDDQEIEMLKDFKVDGLMFDVIGCESTIHDVCHLNIKPGEYLRMVRKCNEHDIPVIPHVILGLDWGRFSGEFDAITLLSKSNPTALVIVVLMPLACTPMQDVRPPPLQLVERFILISRVLFPRKHITLGCAKPPGEYKEKLEKIAIGWGINGIAYPLQETVGFAKQLGLHVRFHETCCSLIYKCS